ncbi:hypertrehalosaemic prohormone-like [Uranotaenia lowii]|uniref:hypertrehalosaemic prohormone-like n=1 Tax=Uranotaenia lowii TaxID=190385 RepID=UPI0024791B8D|nr:hypertrehalosaemic prohormone-like [Uranotaenia lowii]
MELVRLLSVLLICASLIFVCEGQLTFSTGWGNGKRSAAGLTSFNGPFGYDCKPSDSSLMAIYRMIQTEAQKMLECSQKS